MVKKEKEARPTDKSLATVRDLFSFTVGKGLFVKYKQQCGISGVNLIPNSVEPFRSTDTARITADFHYLDSITPNLLG